MPIYAFQCSECGHAFDRLQKMSDPDPEACPACAAHAVRRQVTAPSFRLSGSGWYETDFKKDGDRKRNLTESGDGAERKGDGAERKDEAKAEAKPETSDSKPSGGAEAATKAAPEKAPAAATTPKAEPKTAAKPAPPASPST